MKNIKSLLIAIILIFNMFGITACSNVPSPTEKTSESTAPQTVGLTPKASEEQKSNNFEITLSIHNIHQEAIYSEKIKTEKTNLLEIMSDIAALKLKTEDSEGGKFIVSIMDISYDYGQYWNCYINGESLLENINLCEVKNNDVVDFRYEKVGE